LEVIKTDDPDIAAKNLRFLLESGLIQDQATVVKVGAYLSVRKPGEGVSLPVQAKVGSLAAKLADIGVSGTGIGREEYQNTIKLEPIGKCYDKVIGILRTKIQVDGTGSLSQEQQKSIQNTADAICRP
jgi:hypothetical protein